MEIYSLVEKAVLWNPLRPVGQPDGTGRFSERPRFVSAQPRPRPTSTSCRTKIGAGELPAPRRLHSPIRARRL